MTIQTYTTNCAPARVTLIPLVMRRVTSEHIYQPSLLLPVKETTTVRLTVREILICPFDKFDVAHVISVYCYGCYITPAALEEAKETVLEPGYMSPLQQQDEPQVDEPLTIDLTSIPAFRAQQEAQRETV